MSESDLTSFESTVGDLFRKMGMPDPSVVSRIVNDWDDIAGEPWAGRSKPLNVQGSTLVVEAATPSLVAFLRYGSTDLLETLDSLLGQGKITDIEVRAPSRY